MENKKANEEIRAERDLCLHKGRCMEHFIIIRFSLAFRGKNMRPASKTLNEKRLKQRFILFERICLPSLIKQRYKNNVKIIIKITNNLPRKWKNRLITLTKKYPFIIIQKFNPRQGNYSKSLLLNNIEKYINPNTKIIATTRMDDDDALSPNFTNLISRYMNEKYINKIISFPRGYVLDTKNKRYFLNRRKRIALGLTLIQDRNNYKKFPCGVYSTNHTKWHKKTKCIYPKQIIYIRTVHGTNDSGLLASTRVRLRRGNRNIRLLRRKFPGIKI